MQPVLLELQEVIGKAPGLDAPATVARLTINRAAQSNALDLVTMRAFVQAVESLNEQPSLRALVVTGAGERAFVGGADIKAMAQLEPTSAREFITAVHHCCDALRRCPVPVIGRINGVAFGAGMELVASCDLMVAARDARFGMPEVKLGIPSVVEAAVLPQLVGWGRTREMLLLGEVFSAQEAMQWGLVHRVVDRDQLDQTVDSWINSLLANGPRAVRVQKSLIQQWETLPLPQAIDASIQAFSDVWKDPEPQQMMQAWAGARSKK